MNCPESLIFGILSGRHQGNLLKTPFYGKY